MTRERHIKLSVSPLILLILTTVASAYQPPSKDFLEKEQQARKVAEETLKGRTVRLRLYPDWRKNAENFHLLDLTLTGLSIDQDTLRAACARLPMYADQLNLPTEQILKELVSSEEIVGQTAKIIAELGSNLNNMSELVGTIEQKMIPRITTGTDYPRKEMLALRQSMAGARDSLSRLDSAVSAIRNILNSASAHAAREADKVGRILESAGKLRTYMNMNQRSLSAAPAQAAARRVLTCANDFKVKLQLFEKPEQAFGPATDELIDTAKNIPTMASRLPSRISDAMASIGSLLKTVDPADEKLYNLVQPAMLLILPEDQTDQAVSAVVQGYVCVLTCAGTGSYTLWPEIDVFRQRYDAAYQWWTFQDALGNPIPDAKLDILLSSCHTDGQVGLGQLTLDKQGRTRRLWLLQSGYNFVLTLSHPNYGIARVQTSGCLAAKDSPDTYVLPLVPADSEARTRGVCGVVTDVKGRPVPNVAVWSDSVRSQVFGPSLPLFRRFICKSLTDEQGSFALYMPIERDGELLREPIPPWAKYMLVIDPPDNLNLRSTSVPADAGAPVTIALESVDPAMYFHRLVFEDHRGRITDPNELRKITVTIARRGVKSLTYQYDQWKDGGKFPLGKFYATLNRSMQELRFEPVEITFDSPEEILFSTGQYTLYRGKVVNNITDQPMSGVVVVAGSGVSAVSSSPISDQQLDSLRANALKDNAGDAPIERLYRTEDRVTLTDANGIFQFEYLTGGSLFAQSGLGPFVALEKDFISFAINLNSKPATSTEGLVELPTIRMYPAATVMVEPNAPVTDIPQQVVVSWKIDPNDGASLLDYMRKNRLSTTSPRLFGRQKFPQRIYLPAEVKLSLEFSLSRSTEYLPTKIDNIRLQPGQILDLGKIEFQPALKIAVKVIDAKGQPIVGTRLTCKESQEHFYPLPPTNSEGLTYANVPPYSKGEFLYTGNTMRSAAGHSIQWEVGGHEDRDKLFTLQLPDEAAPVFKGQVINGTNGAPVPNILVLVFPGGHSVDAAGITAEQWDALHALEQPLDSNDPALTPLRSRFGFTQVTKTDDAGRFQFALKPGWLMYLPMVGAVEQGFIGTQWPIDDPSATMPAMSLRRTKDIEVDAAGNVILPPLRLFPAATIVVEPNMPESPLQRPYGVSLYPSVSGDERATWANDLRKAYLMHNRSLQADKRNIVSVPAGAKIDIRMYDGASGQWVPLRFSGLRLKQGQVLDLGQVTFEPAMPVVLKVVDPSGKPVKGVEVRVERIWGEKLFLPAPRAVTDTDGLVWTTVFPNARAKFTVTAYSQPTSDGGPRNPLMESVEHNIGGKEDQNKEFTLRLSDQMLKLLGR